MARIDRAQNVRPFRDRRDAEGGDRDEPEEHEGTEDPADPRRATPLGDEQEDEEADGHGGDERLGHGRDELEPVDRRENRDRGGHDPVAVEEGDSEDAQKKDAAPRRGASSSLRRDETHEREDPALAAVVEPQDPGVVLDADDEKQRPEDEREHSENVFRRYQMHVLLSKFPIFSGITNIPVKLLRDDLNVGGFAFLGKFIDGLGPERHGDANQQHAFDHRDGPLDIVGRVIFHADVICFGIA